MMNPLSYDTIVDDMFPNSLIEEKDLVFKTAIRDIKLRVIDKLKLWEHHELSIEDAIMQTNYWSSKKKEKEIEYYGAEATIAAWMAIDPHEYNNQNEILFDMEAILLMKSLYLKYCIVARDLTHRYNLWKKVRNNDECQVVESSKVEEEDDERTNPEMDELMNSFQTTMIAENIEPSEKLRVWKEYMGFVIGVVEATEYWSRFKKYQKVKTSQRILIRKAWEAIESSIGKKHLEDPKILVLYQELQNAYNYLSYS